MQAFKIEECEGLLDHEQCSHLIQSYGRDMGRSTVLDYSTRSRSISDSRLSTSKKINRSALRSDIKTLLSMGLQSATGAEEERFEPFELVHYNVGEFDAKLFDVKPGCQRTHSVIVYLCDVQRGGETFFPFMNRSIAPKEGKLIVWNNMHDGQVLRAALHESRAVEAGEKWVLVTWVREGIFHD
jgi:prolyl 4-hydroxylase